MLNGVVDTCRRRMEAREANGAAALFILRLVIGYGFMVHGWAKLSRGPDKFAGLLDYLGVPFPEFMAWLVTIAELFGGLAVILGVFVALLSVPLIIIHLVALFTVHLRYGFSSVNTIGMSPDGPVFGPPGFEVNLLYIGGILVLAAFGAGALSIDRALAKMRRRRRARTEAQPFSKKCISDIRSG